MSPLSDKVPEADLEANGRLEGGPDSHGSTRMAKDRLDPGPVSRLAATLGQVPPADGQGATLPPLRHWLYFLSADPADALGYDGHPTRGDFLPASELPQRMYAGGRVRFLAPLPLGASLRRSSEIVRDVRKTGRAGPLHFVTVRHQIWVGATRALEEDHDIVYRHVRPTMPLPTPAQAGPAPSASVSRIVTPDAVMLFRYSALTFNGHRIHYDHRFCQREGYPGLVVHGPLLATLLCDVGVSQLSAPISEFVFRAHAPVIADQPVTLSAQREPGGRVVATAHRCDGVTAMTAWLT